MSRLKAARATERMREMLSVNGPCEELTTSRVPLPLNPHLLLEGLVPPECACFKSAQLPVKLAYRVSPRPIDWDAAAPLTPPARAADAARAVALLSAASGGGGVGGEGVGSGHEGAGLGAVAVAGVGVQISQLPPWCRTALTVSESDSGALRCVMIYKKGDDLRQDQFVLQVGWGGESALH